MIETLFPDFSPAIFGSEKINSKSYRDIVGYVESLQTIGYTETIKIGTRIILSTFLMLAGIRIYDGK